METVELIKKLRNAANEIYSLFNQKIPLWKKEPGTYDKTRWGFYEGDNDGWYRGQTITIHFGAWAGTYGSSSVYKEINVNGDIFRKHFLKYLNNRKKEIMLAVADSIEEEAKSLKEKAESELNAQLEKMKELD